MGTRYTHALASTIADLCPHARRNHTHLRGPEGTWIIGGEAEEQTGQSQHLLSKVGARLFIPFGIKQLCSRLRRVAQRRPPTCPRPHREAQQSQTQLKGATAVSPEGLGMPRQGPVVDTHLGKAAGAGEKGREGGMGLYRMCLVQGGRWGLRCSHPCLAKRASWHWAASTQGGDFSHPLKGALPQGESKSWV